MTGVYLDVSGHDAIVEAIEQVGTASVLVQEVSDAVLRQVKACSMSKSNNIYYYLSNKLNEYSYRLFFVFFGV